MQSKFFKVGEVSSSFIIKLLSVIYFSQTSNKLEAGQFIVLLNVNAKIIIKNFIIYSNGRGINNH